jgi:hypothetical protein
MTMRRPILLAAFAAAALLATVPPVARACDPETMNAALTDVCDAALRPAAEAIAAALPHATAAERGLIERHLVAARQGCAEGDPGIGARTAALLARLAGRIEGRAGLDGPLLASVGAR